MRAQWDIWKELWTTRSPSRKLAEVWFYIPTQMWRISVRQVRGVWIPAKGHHHYPLEFRLVAHAKREAEKRVGAEVGR